jgi:tetratricopeptide (TPR) repeat protein
MTTRWSGRSSAAALALALVLASPLAHAQGDDAKRSAARSFATDGLAAYNAGQYDKAIDLFSRAEALVHAPPHQLYIARASVKVGKLVHAKELYVKITREDLGSGAPKAFAEAQASAANELAEIDPRIPKLTINVTGAGAASAKVTMDGAEVPSALIGAPQPVDPGAHVLRATAAGYRPASDVRLNIAEKASESATLVVDTPVATEPVATTTSTKSEGPSGFRKVSPFLAFGVGAAGLAVGTVFLFKNRGDRDDADAICAGGRCPSARRGEIEELDQSADKAQTFSLIGYGVGAAGIIAGAVLLIVNGSSRTETTTGLVVTPNGVAGRF